MSFQRTGILKRVLDDGVMVGVILVGMRKSDEFPIGVADLAIHHALAGIADGWAGKKVRVEGITRTGELGNYIEVRGITLVDKSGLLGTTKLT